MTREANPIPQGKYVPATRFGNMIFTAGMTPRNNGVLLKTGKIKATEFSDGNRTNCISQGGIPSGVPAKYCRTL